MAFDKKITKKTTPKFKKSLTSSTNRIPSTYVEGNKNKYDKSRYKSYSVFSYDWGSIYYVSRYRRMVWWEYINIERKYKKYGMVGKHTNLRIIY